RRVRWSWPWWWSAESRCTSTSGGDDREEAGMGSDAQTEQVSFDQATTELEALQRAAYATADLMTVSITASDGRFVCELFPRSPGVDLAGLAHRMRSEVID